MVKKAFFDEVDPKPDFPKMEKELLEEWNREGIVKKYLQKNKNSQNYFSFLDGPITANNPMGVHHAWGRTYKDLWQRFNNMRGFKQRFQNGFDCQGLWVEVEVEKELGFKSKKDIENLVKGDVKASIAKFVELCKARVFKFAKIQTDQSKRLGYFMDWDNSYYTLSDENNYMIWQFLKACYDKKLIYKGHDSVPWCPRCGTAISQHEMLTEDYKELTHETVFFKLPAANKDFYFLVWTTTPWTIPANVALAINPKFKYVVWEAPSKEKIVTVDPQEIKDPESKDWFSKHILSESLEKKTEVLGKDLVGLTYAGPFDELERVKKVKTDTPKTFHCVVAAQDLVVATKGTGILHVAPGAGEEDFKLGKKEGLGVIDVIDEDANYYDGLGEFSGQNAKKHPEIIIDYLKTKDAGKFLFKVAPITHRYPACWRCKTELVWRVVDEWYIAMDNPSNSKFKNQNSKSLRQLMIEGAKKINWLPKFGLDRELDWLRNMHDWLISKKRYWGLALPIWQCSNCGHFEVVGGREELKEKAVKGWEKFDGHSPHRPWVDEVKIECVKCDSLMERIPDVGNPWLDAGIVSFSSISEDNKGEPLYWKDKKSWARWFPADFISESFPGQFKNWFYSLLAMSTVLEGREPFKTVLGFATLLGEDGRPMHKSWGNAIEFNDGADKIGVDVMRWMYARQNPSENLLFGYHLADTTRRRFHLRLWNIYNFFVSYANLDSWQPAKSPTLKAKSLSPLDKWLLSRLSQTVVGVSLSLEKYDAYLASEKIESFVDDFSLWYIRRSRDRVGPAAESESDKDAFYETCYLALVSLSAVLAPFNPFISDFIYRNLSKRESVHLDNWPKIDFGVDERLTKDMANLRLVVENVHSIRKAKQIPVRMPLNSLVTVAPFSPPSEELYKYLSDEVNVKKWSITRGEVLNNILDTAITPELEQEAKARELIRQIQEERKKLGMNLAQRIEVTTPWLPEDSKLVQRIKSKTLANSLSQGGFKIWRSRD